LQVVWGVAAPVHAQGPDPSSYSQDSVLTLDEARGRTLKSHPALASARALVEAAQRRRSDAGRRPNPTLSGEVENFGNSGDANRLETTVQLGQTFELGGDRKARSLVAEATVQLVEAELSAEQRTVLATTADRFLDAWGLQERLTALRAAELLAAEAIQAAQERHRAGAAPVTERVRAEAQHALRTVERERAESELELARRLLAAQWGESELTFTTLSPGDPLSDPAARPEWLAAVEAHPQRLRAAAEVGLQEARLREARAARVPDLDLQFGLRHLAETGSSGFVAGVAMPLPLWSLQRGGVGAAEAEVSAARSREQAMLLALRNEVESAAGRVALALSTEEAFRTRIQPAAVEALRQVRAGYRAGRLTYSDLIEAQRAVREADLALTDTTIDLWRARVALDRLIGDRIPIHAPKEELR
jgi:cobalt-zinc-cadmium efflux system outer membrane protein